MHRGTHDPGLWSGWGQDIAIATALGLFLAVIGPYGSYLNGPFWQRLVFQLPCCWTAVAVIGMGVRLAILQFGRGVWLWAAVAGVAAVAMVPVTLINIALAHLLWPFLTRYMTPAKWYGEGLLIAEPASFAFTRLGLYRRERALKRAAVEAQAEASAGARPSLGLLAARAQDVLCLQMEDHYVRVHTARGSHLVLATFGQAQAALDGAPGLRVHRSWWVADPAVASAEFDGRNLRLVLSNGLKAPVARTSVAEVRAKGWLGDTRPE
jgi:DNA-binding LytR/AlgR family response regulator